MRHLKRAGRFALVGACALGLSAAAEGVKQDMTSVVEPASTLLFAVAAEVDPANGPDAVKVASARWTAAVDAAGQLKAAGSALMGPEQAKPGDEWMKDAKALHDLAEAAQEAAKARDGARLSDTANALADTCTACHSHYKAQTAH